MTNQLPQPVERYFAGKNAGDFTAALAAFSEQAVVTDESKTYATKAAIRAWMEETSRKYRDRTEVNTLVADGEVTRVTALVSGDFPGSPIALQFRFVLDDGLISRLEIGS